MTFEDVAVAQRVTVAGRDGSWLVTQKLRTLVFGEPGPVTGARVQTGTAQAVEVANWSGETAVVPAGKLDPEEAPGG